MGFIDSYSKSVPPKFTRLYEGQDKFPYKQNAAINYYAAVINNSGKIKKLCGDLSIFAIDFKKDYNTKIDEIIKLVGVDFISIDDKPLDLVDREAFDKLVQDVHSIVIDGSGDLSTFVDQANETIKDINKWLSELAVNYENYVTLEARKNDAYNYWQGLKRQLESGNVSRGTGYPDLSPADVAAAKATYDHYCEQLRKFTEIVNPTDGNQWVKGNLPVAPQRPDYLS